LEIEHPEEVEAMAGPNRRDAVRPAPDQRRDLRDRLMLPRDERRAFGRHDRGDELSLPTFQESFSAWRMSMIFAAGISLSG
jgi:hypothetical protein